MPPEYKISTPYKFCLPSLPPNSMPPSKRSTHLELANSDVELLAWRCLETQIQWPL
jgi:hypothetical protein